MANIKRAESHGEFQQKGGIPPGRPSLVVTEIADHLPVMSKDENS
jgi:hypothetical protein